MSGVIGSIVLNMRAQTAELRKDLGSAMSSVKSFAGGFANMGTAITAAIGGISLAGVTVGLAEFARTQAEAIDKTNDMAQTAGVAIGSYQALAYAVDRTGGQADALTGALAKLNNNLSDADAKGGPVADRLKELGLSTRDLIKMAPDRALFKIADSIAKIKNPADQTAAAMDVFGKGGVAILNSLKAGGPALAEAAERFRGLGRAVNQIEADQVGDALDRLKDIGEKFASIGSELAIQIAPLVKEAADAFLQFAKDNVNVGQVVETSITGVVTATAYLIDGFVLLKRSVDYVADSSLLKLTTGFGMLIDTFQIAKDLLGKLGNLGGFEIFKGNDPFGNMQLPGQKLLKLLDDLRNKTVDLGDTFKNVKPKGIFDTSDVEHANKVLNDYYKKVQVDVGKLTQELGDKINSVGLNEVDAKIAKLQQRGASEDQLAPLKALSKQLKDEEVAFNAMKSLDEFGKSLTEDLKTPLEKFKEQQAKIQFARENDKIKPEVAQRADLKNLREYKQATGQDQPKFATAIEAGSQEARSALLKATTGFNRMDPSKEQLKVAKDSYVEQQKFNQKLDKVISLFGKPETVYSL